MESTFRSTCIWAEAQGISVSVESLMPNKAGEFDGVSVKMNADYSAEERTYYFTHALGSIVLWSLNPPLIETMFQELRAAKKLRASSPDRLERAIDRYRAFEVESSQFAVWLFARLDQAFVIPTYTNFMRADLEALTQFHRTGTLPVWRDFFATWNGQVENRRRFIRPFIPKVIPAFRPQRVELQEILQEQPQ